ncbi:MAG: substrate-binding domain-containing protein [Thermocladium sp.]
MIIKSRDELIIDNGIKLDSRVIELLRQVKELGSLNAAALRINVPYASAWEWIHRLEVQLGYRLIEKKRGGINGGGTKLTNKGEEFLDRIEGIISNRIDLSIAGSNDEALNLIIKGISARIKNEWIGSLNGLSRVLMMETDVAGIHFLGGNEEIIDEMGLSRDIKLIRGYKRSIGLVTRTDLTMKEIIEGIRGGKLKIKNRNLGSGTRMLMDRFMQDNGIDPINARASPSVAYTHSEIVESIRSGEADVGAAIEYAAIKSGLRFTRLTVESFDLIYLRGNNKPIIRKLESLLESDQIRETINNMPGYSLH